MLHSTLPRAFLTPGLKYLSGYYGEDVGAYPATSYPPFDEHYPRVTEHHVFPTWHTVQRPASPYPLDLSLKPSRPEKNVHEKCKILVPEARHHGVRRYAVDAGEEDNGENIGREDPGVRRNEERLILHGNGEEKFENDHENMRMGAYPEDDARLASPRYHSTGEKISLQSSSSLHVNSVQGYHNQQLLMTPQHHLQGINAPMTPPSTPSPPQCPRKRQREERSSTISPASIAAANARQTNSGEKAARQKKKHARRLKFDEDTSSPVSGTVILGPDEAVVTGDIDPAFNVVEVTEEARAELAKIENRLGPYQCRLCRQLHDDAFQLAQHRCSRIAHVEYRCPECDKRFSCPANLASHRRWHKPRVPQGENNCASTPGAASGQIAATTPSEFSCSRCDAKFSRQVALRKHVANQHPEAGSGSGSGSGNGNANHGNNNDGTNGRSSTGCNASPSSLIGNVDQVLNQAGNQLGISPLTVEVP